MLSIPKILESTLGINPEGNDILSKLLEDESVTVGNIGTKLNELSMADIYNIECFSTEPNGAAYYLMGGKYYLVSAIPETAKDGFTDKTEYYVSKSANIWLFMLYEAEEVSTSGGVVKYDGDGNALVYDYIGGTLSGFSGNVENSSGRVMDATVRQLVDVGILDDGESGYNPSLYTMTLEDVIGEINRIFNELP